MLRSIDYNSSEALNMFSAFQDNLIVMMPALGLNLAHTREEFGVNSLAYHGTKARYNVVVDAVSEQAKPSEKTYASCAPILIDAQASCLYLDVETRQIIKQASENVVYILRENNHEKNSPRTGAPITPVTVEKLPPVYKILKGNAAYIADTAVTGSRIAPPRSAIDIGYTPRPRPQ